MFLVEILGYINSRLILGLIFYLVLLPISLIMRFTGYYHLGKIKKNSSSTLHLIKGKRFNFNRIF